MDRKTREVTQVRAWGRCEMYLRAPGGGRCARNAAQEAHHIIKRSLGGGDGPENIAELCPEHHADVERRSSRSDWLYLVPQDDGGTAYATSPDGVPVWFLWPNIRNEMRGVAEGLVDSLRVANSMRRESGWRLLDSLTAMAEEGDLWELTHEGLDGLAIELGATPSTLRRYLKLGRDFRRLAPGTQEWVRKYSPTLMERAKFGELPAADLNAVQDLVGAVPDVEAVVAEGRQRAARVRAHNAGRILSEVTLFASAVTFEVEVDHAPGADAVELAKRKISKIKAIIPGGVAWRDRLHTVDKVGDEGGGY